MNGWVQKCLLSVRSQYRQHGLRSLLRSLLHIVQSVSEMENG